MEMESTLPSERDPQGTFVPVNLASELKVQVSCRPACPKCVKF